MDYTRTHWISLQEIKTEKYKCGFCGDRVSSHLGLPLICDMHMGARIRKQIGGIYLCPSCSKFTELNNNEDGTISQFPLPKFGNSVKNLPNPLDKIYNEARKCISLGCYTASVMVCRKALMYIAHVQGAKPGKSFVSYINFLENQGFLPPRGRAWVDRIRVKGNEANHELVEATLEDAKNIIDLLEMLLKFNYEYSGE